MVLSIDEKARRHLEEISDLVERRAEVVADLAFIDGKLEALIGDVSKKPVETIGKKPKKGKAAKVNKAGPNDKMVPADSSGRFTPKACCGSKGARHMKTCANHPGNRGAAPASSAPVAEALDKFPVSDPPVSESDFSETKRLRDTYGDLPSSIAKNLGIDEKQVKRIVRVKTYAEYLGQ